MMIGANPIEIKTIMKRSSTKCAEDQQQKEAWRAPRRRSAFETLMRDEPWRRPRARIDHYKSPGVRERLTTVPLVYQSYRPRHKVKSPRLSSPIFPDRQSDETLSSNDATSHQEISMTSSYPDIINDTKFTTGMQEYKNVKEHDAMRIVDFSDDEF